MRTKVITLMIVFGTVLAGVFGLHPDPSSGQQREGWNPCGCFCGFEPPYPPVPPDPVVIFNDHKNCTGILAADACKQDLANLPKEQLASICQRVKASKGSPLKVKCPIFAAYCDGPKETIPPKGKCEPPRADNTPPWFQKDAPCQNRQRGTYSWGQNRRDPQIESITISICGEVIRFEQRGLFDNSQRRPPGVYSFDVCCDTWQKAASTGLCDARRDIDCDGVLNESDHQPLQPNPEPASDTDFVSNSPLTNLPFSRQLRRYMPSQSECKECKWELVKVDYTCKDEVIEFQTTWKCPATGLLKQGEKGFTENRSRCPVPPNRTWP